MPKTTKGEINKMLTGDGRVPLGKEVERFLNGKPLKGKKNLRFP